MNREGKRMNEYRGKHAPSHPWPVASTASVPSRRGRHQKRNRRRQIALFIFMIVILLVIAYPFIEPKIFTVDHEKYEDSKLVLPSNMEYLRVVYVSDIHWSHWFSDYDLERLVKKINDLYPHILLFGGDYAIDFDSAVRFFNLLQKYQLNVRLITCGVLGEMDYKGRTLESSRLWMIKLLFTLQFRMITISRLRKNLKYASSERMIPSAAHPI